MDVGERGEELGVETGGPLVALPADARAGDRVDAVLGQRRDQAGQVAVVLRDRVHLPELADLGHLVGIDGRAQEVEDAVGGHRPTDPRDAPHLATCYGRRSTWPGAIVVPARWLRSRSFQTPSRGSPP